MAAIVSIIGRCILSIEVCHRNQHNKSKLSLYKLFLSLSNYLKQLKLVKRWSDSVIKVGVACVGIHILGHLK